MKQTKEPKTDALKRLRGILQATMTDCKEASEIAKGEIDLFRYYQGKYDGFNSALSLLEALGPKIEEEAFELGYQEGQEFARTMGAQGR